ncbi:hypothetical protein D6D10_08732 [Aureobasidium pullulans]|uniref:Uncharacterized protein n=1 Tax=Aureobasidium pullulans TaxID=5580 RepID=A0A4S9EAD7_AURPU|nr:hypothetical protein D6D10_08732 [Aureobasidium pullulans]
MLTCFPDQQTFTGKTKKSFRLFAGIALSPFCTNTSGLCWVWWCRHSSLPTYMISLQHKCRHVSRSTVVILGRQCRVNGSLSDCIEKEYKK